MRAVEGRVGIKAPTAALTDIFGKAGLRARLSTQKRAASSVSGGEAFAEQEAAVAVGQIEEVSRTAPSHAAHSPIPSQAASSVPTSPRSMPCYLIPTTLYQVLTEVASTNKKVFLTIDEVLIFLGMEDAWTEGDTSASGLAWELLGEEPPSLPIYGKPPVELSHEKFSEALATRVSQSKMTLEFSADEWKEMGVEGLRIHHYIRVELGSGVVVHCKPKDEQALVTNRPKTYSESFSNAGCTLCRYCKHLNDQQLKDEVKISRVGHRMMLLEQFRFL